MLSRTLATIALLTVTTLATAQDPVFSGDEIKKAWSDKELMGRGRNGVTFYMTLKADGSATFSNGNVNDTGKWRGSETGYCATWQRLREGKEGCFTVRKGGSSFIVYNEDGSESGRIHSVR